jgi:hypothetical protein
MEQLFCKMWENSKFSLDRKQFILIDGDIQGWLLLSRFDKINKILTVKQFFSTSTSSKSSLLANLILKFGLIMNTKYEKF